jgi:phosphoribosyl-ATP pyrophosphohydrolase/phosphoribosyl-AMP cyclohydrolase
MKKPNLRNLAWAKGGGLIPAVVQDRRSRRVLMLGWMDKAALEKTLASGLVTFYSRSRMKLWTKGETSGNILRLYSIAKDCDADTFLIEADPAGPACHRGTASCFDAPRKRAPDGDLGFLDVLEAVVDERFRKRPKGSYVAGLIAGGPDRMAQKVGEEAVETVIAAKSGSRARLESEAADLLFHLMVLLRAKGSSLGRVARTLKGRHAAGARPSARVP